MIVAILSLLGATLTLPGIAGIVLTIGMAVDANVLIYERIREEGAPAARSIQAIEFGFRQARLATIVDSNVTTLIAAIVLFCLGSGPVHGFAVTFAIGIMTTLFTAFTLTRWLIVDMGASAARPTELPMGSGNRSSPPGTTIPFMGIRRWTLRTVDRCCRIASVVLFFTIGIN